MGLFLVFRNRKRLMCILLPIGLSAICVFQVGHRYVGLGLGRSEAVKYVTLHDSL